MARKSASENVVSLFPFLAVLVCVMGSLIFLLLATTKRMHDIAVAEAEARLLQVPDLSLPPEPAPPIPQPQLGSPIAADREPAVPRHVDVAAQRLALEQSWREKLSHLERRRDRLQEDLQRQQTLHKAAVNEARAVEGELAQQETRLRGLLADPESSVQESTAESLAALEQQIAELRKRLRERQHEQQTADTKFAVVPFDVRSGTTRRPILIECTDTGLRFLPEDVIITPSDLEGFTERYNPLLTGAAALAAYWTEVQAQAGAPPAEREPYVLLLVRPSGTVAYYVAMKMLGSLPQPFGYELIDDAIELQPPPLDPQAQAICREAVSQQLTEREIVAQQMRQGPRGGASGRSSKKKFQVADVTFQKSELGERSWEKPDQFEGRRPPGQTAKSPRPGSREAGQGAGAAAANGAASPAASTPPRRTAPPAEIPVGPEAAPAAARASSPQRARAPRLHNANASPKQKTSPHAVEDFQLAHLARRHWGQSDPRATIGVEQDVTIRVDAQQMIVADRHVITYLPEETPTDLFLRLIEAVDVEAQTWGRPRSGFYWTPRLRFVISPGGNQVFARLDPLAAKSGLATTRDFTLDAVTPTADAVTPTASSLRSRAEEASSLRSREAGASSLRSPRPRLGGEGQGEGANAPSNSRSPREDEK